MRQGADGIEAVRRMRTPTERPTPNPSPPSERRSQPHDTQRHSTTPIVVSTTRTESYLYEVRRYLWSKAASMAEADRLAEPLAWYIWSGRASTAWLKTLYSLATWRVGRSLLKGGSTAEAIDRIKTMVVKAGGPDPSAWA